MGVRAQQTRFQQVLETVHSPAGFCRILQLLLTVSDLAEIFLIAAALHVLSFLMLLFMVEYDAEHWYYRLRWGVESSELEVP